MSYYETQEKCRVHLGMHFWATYTIFPLYRIPVVALKLLYRIGFVSIRLLIDQHLQLLASKSDTSRSIHVFQRAINNLEILFLASISTYKPETSLTVFFARKLFRWTLKVEFTRLSWNEQFHIDICIWFWIWYVLFCINRYALILICVQIHFKVPSRQIGVLLRNKVSNMRLKLEISKKGWKKCCFSKKHVFLSR